MLSSVPIQHVSINGSFAVMVALVAGVSMVTLGLASLARKFHSHARALRWWVWALTGVGHGAFIAGAGYYIERLVAQSGVFLLIYTIVAPMIFARFLVARNDRS